MSDSWTSDRAKVASLTRSRPADDPELIAARRDLRASRLQDHVQRVVAEWPPLTDDQLARVAGLLKPTPGNGGKAA